MEKLDLIAVIFDGGLLQEIVKQMYVKERLNFAAQDTFVLLPLFFTIKLSVHFFLLQKTNSFRVSLWISSQK